MIEINEEKRDFRFKGAKVPSVTEILSWRFPPNGFWTEEGRVKGTAVHDFALFLAQGNELAEPPDERIAGKVRGFRKFLEESCFKFVGGEERLFDPILGYCGKPDLWGSISGRTCLIDVKNGGKLKTHALQLAAYSNLLSQPWLKPQDRFGLYLKDDGYSLVKYDDKNDFHYWNALVLAYKAGEIYK